MTNEEAIQQERERCKKLIERVGEYYYSERYGSDIMNANKSAVCDFLTWYLFDVSLDPEWDQTRMPLPF